jgi:hypothetical protein
MTAVGASGGSVQIARPRLTAVNGFLLAGALYLGAAGLQLVAAIERWVVLGAASTRGGIPVEDHLFDYSYPAAPWEGLGSTAQFFGAGVLLLALGFLAMARAVPPSNSAFQRVLVIMVAVPLAGSGAHALISGVMGAPTILQASPLLLLLSLVECVGLISLSVWWLKRAWPASVACVFLLGNTIPGYLLASFQIAPAIVGYQSHDTTPWTEAVVAATAAAAALALLIAAGAARAARTAKTAEA